MKTYILNDLISEAQSSNVPQIFASATGGKYSFGVVNSRNNGKRVTLSKTLAKDLGIVGEENKLMLLPIPSKKVLLLGTELPAELASVCFLKGEDKKISYSADIVKLVADSFQLDFDGRTSMSFADIEIDTTGATPVAIVNMDAPSGQVEA